MGREVFLQDARGAEGLEVGTSRLVNEVSWTAGENGLLNSLPVAASTMMKLLWQLPCSGASLEIHAVLST